MTGFRTAVAPLVVILGALAAAVPAAAQDALSGRELVAALRDGGYNVYFPHAATDWGNGDDVDAAGDWTSCDPDEMRQLSDRGRATARAIGAAIRALDVPVSEVLSSEYCRCAETARLMDLGPVRTTRKIMNTRADDYVGGRAAVVRRAREVLSSAPPEGGNRIIVGHGNLMRAATGAYAGEGGSAIYRPDPDAEHGFVLVARLSPDDWQRLAERGTGG